MSFVIANGANIVSEVSQSPKIELAQFSRRRSPRPKLSGLAMTVQFIVVL